MKISTEDLDYIKKSLGRTPRGAFRVERYGKKNNPLVISVLPIVETKPFPTCYWLVSPELKKSISHLERDGLIGQLEKEIQNSPELIKKLQQDHLNYQSDRKELAKNLAENELTLFKQMNWDKSGIGGIQDWDHIKCLHLHFAHYLAKGNIVGQLIEEKFNLLENV